jgi:hypothetical protein
MIEAARMLSRAIGNRWDGWQTASVGNGPDGSESILLAYDAQHTPALAVGREYQGYPIHLVPTKKPKKA